MSKEKDNMRIWSQVCRTDPKLTKSVPRGRFKLTAIDAQSQRKRATEIFGPFGQGWGVDPDSVHISYLDFGDREKMAVYQAVLWWMDGTKRYNVPICSTILIVKNDKPDDEWLKKVSTDALTKGLSTLGFNSDVFEGKFDDNRYVEAMAKEFATEDKSVNPKVDKPGMLDTYKSILMQTAMNEGTEAFRLRWKAGVEGVPGEAEKACKEYIKTTPSEQEWLQSLKEVCQTTDKKLLEAS